MTNWITSRWDALDTWGRIMFVLMITGFTLSTISFIIHPTLLLFAIAFTNLSVAFYSSEANYWRSQARAWCGMNHLARNLSRALDTGSDILITTNSNGEEDLIVIDRKETTP